MDIVSINPSCHPLKRREVRLLKKIIKEYMLCTCTREVTDEIVVSILDKAIGILEKEGYLHLKRLEGITASTLIGEYGFSIYIAPGRI